MSFDNLNKTEKRLNFFLLSLLTLIAVVIAFLVPLIGYLGWALMPLPATLLVLTGRKRDGVICAVLGTLVLLFFDPVLGAVIMAAIIGAAFTYKRLEEENAPAGRYIIYISLIFTGAGLLYLLLGSLASGINLASRFVETYRIYIGQLEEDAALLAYGRMMGLGSEQISGVLEQTQRVLFYIPYMMPGMWIAVMGFAGIINYAFSAWLGQKYGIRLKKLPSFGKWDLPWFYVWGVIAGIVVILVPSFIDFGADTFFYVLGANLLLVFVFIYFILGLAVLWGLFNRFRIQLIWRIIILTVLAFFFGLVLIAPILGLLDIWVNLRRLKRE